MERAAGIEPVRSAWEAEILPLNYARGDVIIIHHFPGFVKYFSKISSPKLFRKSRLGKNISTNYERE